MWIFSFRPLHLLGRADLSSVDLIEQKKKEPGSISQKSKKNKDAQTLVANLKEHNDSDRWAARGDRFRTMSVLLYSNQKKMSMMLFGERNDGGRDD